MNVESYRRCTSRSIAASVMAWSEKILPHSPKVRGRRQHDGPNCSTARHALTCFVTSYTRAELPAAGDVVTESLEPMPVRARAIGPRLLAPSQVGVFATATRLASALTHALTTLSPLHARSCACYGDVVAESLEPMPVWGAGDRSSRWRRARGRSSPTATRLASALTRLRCARALDFRWAIAWWAGAERRGEFIFCEWAGRRLRLIFRSRCIRTCFAMLAGISLRMTDRTPERCSITSATGIFNTPSVTRSCHRSGSNRFGTIDAR